MLKEDLENMKPNEVINHIIAHEYSMEMNKPQGAASSSCQASLTAKHTCKPHQPRRQEATTSEDEEEEEEESDDEESSSEDEQVSRAIRYHHDKVAKHVRKLYKLGYETRIRKDAVGVFKMASKKKSKTKKHLACSAILKPSPPPMCLMAKGNNDEGDDDSSSSSEIESDETCEMMNLITQQQEYILKQDETLKANEELHASFVSRYENLLNKFNLLDK
jgi:hypothetical protein